MKRGLTKVFGIAAILLACTASTGFGEEDRVTYQGKDGPGKGKHIAFVSGCWEYRPEEAFPMLAKILAERHGFKCTVIFPIDPKDGTINPNASDNMPGMKALAEADIMVTLMMDLELPDDQMKHIVDFVESGKPIIGIRSSTLAFSFRKNKASKYIRYRKNSTEWPGGFGQQILGSPWCGHHGHHARESTRGLIHGPQRSHPILRGVKDIWGSSDVYVINKLPKDATVLAHGMVLTGMNPDDPPNLAKPIMPMIWTREFKGPTGKDTRVFTTTIGTGPDMACEDLRRAFVNGCYWALHLEDKIPAEANVAYVDDYKPSFFGRNKFKKGLKPDDLRIKQ
jgi:type 1 glutamine amidotransferase